VDEATSTRAVRELRKAGWPNARALLGGWQAWQDEGLPVETKNDVVPSA
jgi:3-mercaptopyruvate sulfurtransferase SseA